MYNQRIVNNFLEDEMNIATLVSTLSAFAWLAFFGLLVAAVARAARQKSVRALTGGILATMVLAIVFTVLGLGLVYINPEERGVVKSAFNDQGLRPEALGPGLHWITPFAEEVLLYPISRTTYTMSVATTEGQLTGDDSIRARTKDGQEVFVDASIVYQIDPSKIIQLHITWQLRYEDELVRPTARSTIRDAVSQYGIEEVVSTKRAEMEELITNRLAAAMSDNYLTLVSFLLRDIHFSPEYAAAVEQKQIAEQLAQQAKFTVEQKRQEAEQARQVAQGIADAVVIKAKGDAEARLIQAQAEAGANDLIAASLAGRPELLMYLYISKLAPNIQIMLLPSGSPFIFPLPDVITQ